MASFDTIIRGGKVVTGADAVDCDIGISGGRITALGEDLGKAEHIVDARNRIVLPGGIDSHVHLAQPSGPGIVMADDFESGTRSAAFGGNTTVLTFCMQQKGEGLRAAVTAYHAKAERQCYTDYGFHLVISDPTPQVLGQELPALIQDGFPSFKVFMTYEGLALTDEQILKVMTVARETGALVMVHAENYDIIRFLTDSMEREGKTAPQFHADSRPIPVEREATHRALTLAEIMGVPVVIVHVSNGEALEEIRRARLRGVKVLAETCPQYLVLTAKDLEGLNMEGAKYVCSPPPRDEASQRACWGGLIRGDFNFFSSDHCPFRYEDEQGKLFPKGRTSFRWVPNGIPGVETRLPILFSEGVMKKRIGLSQFAALTATNHAKAYGLFPKKGHIAIGADADLAIWDPAVTRTIRHADLHDGCDYTPYEGIEVTGWPVTTILRGKIIVEAGKLAASKGAGNFLPRPPLNGIE
ncbi:MAG TPA: dihydropyrimidinase [Hyphomicrobiales bacterium]|nr:dihydropyrimidinase [Hyphomicrobiales bacterium]